MLPAEDGLQEGRRVRAGLQDGVQLRVPPGDQDRLQLRVPPGDQDRVRSRVRAGHQDGLLPRVPSGPKTVCAYECVTQAGHLPGHPHPLRADLRDRDLHGERQEVRALPGHPLRERVRPGSADREGLQDGPDRALRRKCPVPAPCAAPCGLRQRGLRQRLRQCLRQRLRPGQPARSAAGPLPEQAQRTSAARRRAPLCGPGSGPAPAAAPCATGCDSGCQKASFGDRLRATSRASGAVIAAVRRPALPAPRLAAASNT